MFHYLVCKVACFTKVFTLLLPIIAFTLVFYTHWKLTSGISIEFLPLRHNSVFHHCNVPGVDIIRDMFISAPLGSLRSVCVQCCRHVAADRFIKKRVWQTAGELATGHGDLTTAAPSAASGLHSLTPSVGSRRHNLIK